MYDDAGSLGDMGEEKDEKGLIKYCSGQVIRRTNFSSLIASREKTAKNVLCG